MNLLTRPTVAVVCSLLVLLAVYPALGQGNSVPFDIVEADTIDNDMKEKILMVVDPFMFDIVREEPEADEVSEARGKLLEQFRPGQATPAYVEALSDAITNSRMAEAAKHPSTMVRINAMLILTPMVDGGSDVLVFNGLKDKSDAVKRLALGALGERMRVWKTRGGPNGAGKIANGIKEIVALVDQANPPHTIVVSAGFEALLKVDTPASRAALIELLNKRVPLHLADPDLSYAPERAVIESFPNTLALEPRQDLTSIKGLSRAMSRYSSLTIDQIINNRIAAENEDDVTSMQMQCLTGLGQLGAALSVAPPANPQEVRGLIKNARWDELAKLINEDWRGVLTGQQFGLKPDELKVEP